MKVLLFLGKDYEETCGDMLFLEDSEGPLAVTQRMNDLLLSSKDHSGPPAVKWRSWRISYCFVNIIRASFSKMKIMKDLLLYDEGHEEPLAVKKKNQMFGEKDEGPPLIM
jgi:hypothetical protein